MARYHILVDFMGSQDGRFSEPFKAGTQADLSDYLVSCLPAASIRRIEEDAVPATTTAGKKQRKAAVSPAPTSTVGTTTGKDSQ